MCPWIAPGLQIQREAAAPSGLCNALSSTARKSPSGAALWKSVFPGLISDAKCPAGQASWEGLKTMQKEIFPHCILLRVSLFERSKNEFSSFPFFKCLLSNVSLKLSMCL